MTINYRGLPLMILLLSSLVLLSACGEKKSATAEEVPPPAPSRLQPDYASAVHTAHGGGHWEQKQALQADIDLTFAGRNLINGTLTMLTDVSKVRIDQHDSIGTSMIWTGDEAAVSPAPSGQRSARFHLLTWPYFIAAPFKISDPGTFLEEQGTDSINGKQTEVGRLTFASGVGDSPDDWYVLYKDDKDVLQAMAYIVTYGPTSQEKAEEDPHAIVYESYTEVDGVLLSDKWTFWEWRQDSGLTRQIGEATLSNLHFTTPAPDFFEVPEDHRIDHVPGGK